MHLKVTDEKARDVLLVFVDGKVVPLPLELDTIEGWVDCYIPKNIDLVKSDDEHYAVESLEELEFEVIRKYGKVDVKFKGK
jgi:hypothetical protein